MAEYAGTDRRQSVANVSEVVRQSMVTVILAIIVGIGSSWVATQAQMAVLQDGVSRNTEMLKNWQTNQERMATLLVKMEERMAANMKEIDANTDNVAKISESTVETKIKIALLEQRLGILYQSK